MSTSMSTLPLPRSREEALQQMELPLDLTQVYAVDRLEWTLLNLVSLCDMLKPVAFRDLLQQFRDHKIRLVSLESNLNGQMD